MFFFYPHKSVNSSLTIFGIYQTIWPMWHFELFKMKLMGLMVIYIALDLCHYNTLPVYLVGFFLTKFLTLLIKNNVHIHEQNKYLRS